MPQLELKNVTKAYKTGELSVNAVCGISISVNAGEMVAIMGPSGSGKSTLMHIMGLLDRPTSGEFFIDDKKIDMKMPDSKLAKLRSEKIGFIFQQFNLLHKMSALSNVMMPTIYRKIGKTTAQKRALELLTMVGLAERAKHKPSELSGGETQRVAIARALINDPDIILADEPTGNLDSKSGLEVIEVLKDLNKKGKTIIIITHDPKVAALAQKTIHIMDGQIDKEAK